MATFESVGLVHQIIHNVYGMVRDMRDNAAAYKAQLLAGRPAADVRATMLADAGQYLLRVQSLTDVVTRNLAGVTAALTEQGLTVAQLNNHRTQLAAAANHTLAASLETSGQVEAEADWILANVPNYERVW